MAVFQTRHRVTGQKLAIFVALGFLIGSVLGYIFMATVHAVRIYHRIFRRLLAIAAPGQMDRTVCHCIKDCCHAADAGDQS